MNAQTMTHHDLEAEIVQRRREDEGFRKEFFAAPTGSFSKYLQVLAANLPKIAVHEEEPGSWHIVLPAKATNGGALSEEDLEKVAGGTIFVLPVTTAVIALQSAVITSALGIGASLGVGIDKGQKAGW
jgi:hypothetical protein